MANLDPTGLVSAAVSELFKVGRNAVEDVLVLESNAEAVESDYVADLKPLFQRLVSKYANSTLPKEELAMLEAFLQFLERMSTLTTRSRQSAPISPWKRLVLSREIKATKERVQAFHSKATALCLRLALEQGSHLDELGVHMQRQQQLLLSTVGIERDVSWASPSSLFGAGAGRALDAAVGIDHWVELLKHWLLRDDGQWMLVYGVGGIGKTYLVQCVCSLPKVRDHFEGGILFVHLDDDSGNSQLGVLKRALDEEPTDKRRLVVLDGMRNRNLVGSSAWSPWLERNTNTKVLVTSTSRNVLQQLDVLKPAKYPLSIPRLWAASDAYKLFCRHAFGSDQAPQPLQQYAQELAEQCGGSPLLLEVTGRSMRLKKDPAQWKLAVYKLSRGIVDDQSAAVRLLKLSYNELGSSTQKRRFLALAVLAGTGSRCFELDVIRYAWEALGLLGDCYSGGEAKDALSQLLDASMVQDGDDFRVDILIGRLARDLVKEEKLPYAFVQSVQELCSLNCELASIEINTASNTLPKFNSPKQASVAKVLRVSGIRRQHLPISIGDLKKLRFLDLELIDELGEALPSIGQLGHLIFLRFKSTSVEQEGLDSLGELANLKFLDICSELWPPLVDLCFLKDLHALRTLRLRVPHRDCIIPIAVSWLEVSRCRKLKLLEVHMQLRGVKSIQELLFPLKKLARVELGKFCACSFDTSWLTKLTSVRLDGSGMLVDLSYLEHVPHLCKLGLDNFASQRLFSADARFPSLMELALNKFPSLIELHIPDAPQLVRLTIDACPELLDVGWEFAQFPCLRELVIRSCHGLRHLPHSIPSLEKLIIVDCELFERVLLPYYHYPGFSKLYSITLKGLSSLRHMPDFETHFPRLCQLGGTLYVDRRSQLHGLQLESVQHLKVYYGEEFRDEHITAHSKRASQKCPV